MRRRVLSMLGFALAVLCSPTVRGQERQPVVPMPVDFPGLPKLAAPVPPLPRDDAAKASEPKLDVKISPNTGMPRIDPPSAQKLHPISELALQSSEYIDSRYVANSAHPDDPGFWERLREHNGDQIHRLVSDFKNFYWSENLMYVGIAVAVVAPIANTHADQGFRNWYQAGVGQGRSRGLDDTARYVRYSGEYKYAIPAYLALSGGGALFPDQGVLFTLGEFGDRSLRAMAVGAPAVGILQYGLGAGQPSTQDSHWHPGRFSHAISGHAFVGAIPFLTAASMTDSPALQALFIAGSFAPAWSRIHTDDHYLSQVLLGWSIAYLSVRSVNQTESQFSRFRVVPVDIPKGVGMGVQVSY